MTAAKKKETKDTKPKPKGVVSIESSIMTRLEVVEKMLLITRDELNDMKTIFERIRSRLGI